MIVLLLLICLFRRGEWGVHCNLFNVGECWYLCPLVGALLRVFSTAIITRDKIVLLIIYNTVCQPGTQIWQGRLYNRTTKLVIFACLMMSIGITKLMRETLCPCVFGLWLAGISLTCLITGTSGELAAVVQRPETANRLLSTDLWARTATRLHKADGVIFSGLMGLNGY